MSEPQPRYVPILKGRLGELSALSHADDIVKASCLPIVEIAPAGLDEDEDGNVDPRSVHKAMDSFRSRLVGRWPEDQRIIVDAGLLPHVGGLVPPVDTAIDFGRENFSVTPTVRPSDRNETIQGVAEQIHQWGLEGACIRLAGDDLDDTESPIDESLDRVVSILGIASSEIDLVLDLGAVSDEKSASFASRIARIVLSETPRVNEWRTLTVASGAFPADLGFVQPEVPAETQRFDLALWLGLQTRVRGRKPIFGDYGVAHPSLAGPAAFAPAPQLRYTTDESWLIVKGRRSDRRGASQFFDICDRIVKHSAFTPGLSWGDERIEHAARAASNAEVDAPTGNASTWRAIGTSHHLAATTRMVASLVA